MTPPPDDHRREGRACDDMDDLEAWPNCSVADCEYKACLSLNSDKCFHHTQGRNPPMSYEEYQGMTKETTHDR